ncbi:hypothetical protein B2G71_23280 [Novosphingobium sp. PC22D]|uniref:hypothetical protein n=1 Tax=Novosphingobium sp. PC22D TaxID=1962403 RepID=UPI000BF16AF7|nr:hypothetical protein [Novosphingobium sp. PC22D]PEQ10253.1 hypothetical protein B2G71_23280 [Novosphingobium sp. PC22D]
MKRLAPVLFAFAAACSSASEAPEVAEGEEHVACAVAGASEMKPVCAVERSELDGKLSLVVRHPDGAFRRFDVLSDGRGLAVTDGADEAQTTLEGDKLAVTVGEDRYLFPVTAKRAAGK